MRACILYLLFVLHGSGFAQQPTEPDSITISASRFENHFYESLKHRAMENYDKAINSLHLALKENNHRAVVYHELGKNYLSTKDYPQAEMNLKKALEFETNNKWIYTDLYNLYFELKDFEKAITNVEKIIDLDPQNSNRYQEKLVELYIYTNQDDKAIALIEELEQKLHSSRLKFYKEQLLSRKVYTTGEVEQLEEKILKNPKDPSLYITLLYKYTDEKQDQKAFEVAKKLAQNFPESDWAHVYLYRFYLDQNNNTEALKSIYRVLENEQIDVKIKHLCFNDLLQLTFREPIYHSELAKAIQLFRPSDNIAVAKEVGKYFFNKNEFGHAETYFKIAINNNPNDLESVLLYLEALLKNGKTEQLATDSEKYMDLFPLQPDLYYYRAVALFDKQQLGKAKDNLEEGLDYLTDNIELEKAFYSKLIEVYTALKDEKNKNKYIQKLNELSNKK
ncbi:MAG: tetratricopeptide repeat protein [Bacteroidota bacterium]|nr:tetratricopeptide repeat protein [Bacteroidota bacterium]